MSNKGSKVGHVTYLIISIILSIIIFIIIALYSGFSRKKLKQYKKENDELHKAHRIMTWITTIMWIIIVIVSLLLLVGFFTGIDELIAAAIVLGETAATASNVLSIQGDIKNFLNSNNKPTEDEYVKEHGRKVSKILIIILIINIFIFLPLLIGCLIAINHIDNSGVDLKTDENLKSAVNDIRVCIASITFIFLINFMVIGLNVYHKKKYNDNLRKIYKQQQNMINNY